MMTQKILMIFTLLCLSFNLLVKERALAQPHARLDSLDWPALLIQLGDLPGRWVLSSMTASPPPKFKDVKLPPAAKVVNAQLNQGLAGVTVFIFNSAEDAESAWYQIHLELPEGEKEDPTIGEKAEYSSVIIAGVPAATAFVFTRCRAVVYISLTASEVPTVAHYARNLDKRLRTAICF